MKTQKKREFRPILFIGLALWALGLILPIIWEKMGNPPQGQEALMGLVKHLIDMAIQISPVAIMTCIFLWLCLIQPVMEEFAYRFWGKGKEFAYIVSAIGIGLFAVLSMDIWSILLAVLCILPMFLIKNDRKKKLVTIISTSVVFALMHISGFSGFSAYLVFGIMAIFGMALVMSYIVINYRFIYSVALHVLNNSLAILVPFFFFGTDVSFSSNSYEAHLETMPISQAKEMLKQGLYTDSATNTMTFYGELPEIVKHIHLYDKAESADFNENAMYIYEPDNTNLWRKMVLTISPKSDSYSEDFIAGLIQNGYLRSDTNLVAAYEIGIADSAIYFANADVISDIDYLIGFVMEGLKEYYAIPFTLAAGIDPATPFYFYISDLYEHKIPTTKDLSENPMSILDHRIPQDELFEKLRTDYGLSVTESKTKKLKKIRFYVE